MLWYCLPLLICCLYHYNEIALHYCLIISYAAFMGRYNKVKLDYWLTFLLSHISICIMGQHFSTGSVLLQFCLYHNNGRTRLLTHNWSCNPYGHNRVMFDYWLTFCYLMALFVEWDSILGKAQYCYVLSK